MSASSGRPLLHPTPPFCLTVAGLDPSGGAGATADLRVFRRLGAFGLAALTALTPQNTRGVKGIHPASPAALRQELDGLFEDFPVAAAKTGQIPNRELAGIVVRKLERHPLPLVVDPVMVPTRGRWLVEKDAVAYMKKRLLPLAAVITPNLPEAEWLSGVPIRSLADMERAVRALVPAQARAVVLTGGDGVTEGAYDLFFDGETLRWFKTRKRPVGDIHGTGCHYSAALCAFLAQGRPLPDAVARAKRLLTSLIDQRLIDPTGRMKVLHS